MIMKRIREAYEQYMQDTEQWKVISAFPRYSVSTFARVRNDRTGRILKPGHSKGYPAVWLTNEKGVKPRTIHRLMAQAFIPNPDNLPEVNHKDGVPRHLELSNLEWTTRAGNTQHAYDIGLAFGCAGAKNGMAKFTDAEIAVVRKLLNEGHSQYAIARLTGISQSYICNINLGRRRKL
jgi:hypothetical protein